MTSDCAPMDMVGVEERLLTRFRWGLTTRLERPEKELRKILQELIDLDYNYKNGLIDINIGLEAILCRYC